MTAKRLTVRYNSTASRRKGRIDGYVSTLELMREPLVQNQLFLTPVKYAVDPQGNQKYTRRTFHRSFELLLEMSESGPAHAVLKLPFLLTSNFPPGTLFQSVRLGRELIGSGSGGTAFDVNNSQVALLLIEREKALIPVNTNAFSASQQSTQRLNSLYAEALIVYRDGSVDAIDRIEPQGFYGNSLPKKLQSAALGTHYIKVQFRKHTLSLEHFKELVTL